MTAEPSKGPIGRLAAELTETVTGHALACLYAADRYHHVEHEIEPLLQAGHTVISDRYIASGLVIQRFDNVDPVFLWQLNEVAKQPDLAVILDADPEVITSRLAARGPHNRFQRTPSSSYAEVEFYQQAAETLSGAGFAVCKVDCSSRPPERSAAIIRHELMSLRAGSEVMSS
ncbi:dTMP kinase [Lentzea jiangxiensis]|uniref:Thymidylate kinase n=2 Tax=Lentzea jiangxiensis TaxID=641025 RepID=A0A1H0X7N9_9PSEU|nr:dTMP kinase [Lentzea jiangxiensis]